MSITCYALMFLLVTTKLHYVLIIADSDFIEEFACFSMFFATTNHFSCHWLIEVWLVYIFVLTQWLVYIPACITLLPRHPVLFLTF